MIHRSVMPGEIVPEPSPACRPATARREGFLIVVLLLVATLAVFQRAPRFDYVGWDDNIHVYENPFLTATDLPHVLHFWRAPYQNLYIPVTYSLYALLAAAAHLPHPVVTPSAGMTILNPAVFHAANLVLHLVNVLLAFVVLRLVVRNDRAAGAGALLFGIHPVQVEAVAWISETKGLLAGCFSLVALWQYLCWRGREETGTDTGRHGVRYGLATLVFGLALLSKPTAVAVPVVALALDYGMRRSLRRSIPALLPWGAMALALVLLTRHAQPVPHAAVAPLWGRPFVAGDALAFYLSKIILPVSLGIDYGRTPAFVLGHAWGYLTWLAPLGLALAAWRCKDRRPWLAAASGVFAAALLPNSGLIPFYFQVYSTVADRYAYLAMLGPALALAAVVAGLMAHPDRWKARAGFAFCGVVLALLGVRSLAQARCWQDSIALFEHAVAVNPQSWVAHSDLGAVLAEQGRTGEAIVHLRAAVRIKPDFVHAYVNLRQAYYNEGLAQFQAGNGAQALDDFRAALRIEPGYMPAQIAERKARQALSRNGLPGPVRKCPASAGRA